MGRFLKRLFILIFIFAVLVFVLNTNLLTAPSSDEPTLLAHRGMAQRFSRENLSNDTCTAAQSLPTEHEYLENTIASMQAAISAGADMIELDIHPTTDGKFAVFHDWTIDCRTEGSGVTRELSMDYLRTLDIGFGYTTDNGKTFPLRGKGVGLMPTLEEVLAALPEQKILINIKSGDATEGEKLAVFLGNLMPERRKTLYVYGDDRPISKLKSLLPDVVTMSKTSLKACVIRYIGYGWTGIMPEQCKNTMLGLPVNIAPWLWGWPNKFANRMKEANTTFFVVGPYGGEGFSTGIDSEMDLAKLPAGYSGGILTNEIELISKLVKSAN